jgi:hypothetical protein
MYPNRVPSHQSNLRTRLPFLRVYAVAAALLLSGFLEATSTAAAKSLVSTSAGRALLLQQFSGQGNGGQARGGDTRFRANRRGPDVGFISLDPICYSCLLPSLPSPSYTPVPPEISSPQPSAPPSPQPSPVVSSPVSAPLPEPTMEAPAPLVSSLPLKAVIEPAPQIQEAPMKSLTSASLQPNPSTTSQTPGPLPILGVGATFAFSRKLRGRIRASLDN